MTFTHALSTNNYGPAKFIVDASAANGTHTTIASALTSASSGDTIFIRPGTYTENLTLKSGVNLASYASDGISGQVTISGKCSFSATGAVYMTGIRLQTNGDYALEVTGANVSTVVLDQCQVVNTNNTAINYTCSNASSSIFLDYCLTFVGATNALYTSSSPGSINLFWCQLSSSSTTASTMSAGGMQMISCYSSEPMSFSGATQIVIFNSTIRSFPQNTTCVTTSGTSSGIISNSWLQSGTASAISVGNILTVTNCDIHSSNTNAITGAGNLSYSGLQFSGTSSTINTTTQSLLAGGPSMVIGSANSGLSNTVTLINTSNTASSAANMAVVVGGATAADPTHQAVVSGVTTWTWGADNSVTSPTADPFVIAQGTALGTNNVMSVATSGEINYPLQPAFLAVAATQSNATGDGTSYTMQFTTEVFDQNSDFDGTSTFTAPVTGRYKLQSTCTYTGIGAANTNVNAVTINTSNRGYGSNIGNLTVIKDAAFNVYAATVSTLADMDAADTCTILAQAGGGTKTVGFQATSSTFSGALTA